MSKLLLDELKKKCKWANCFKITHMTYCVGVHEFKESVII